MRYIVTDDCIGCGQCAMTCQKVFQMQDSGKARAIEMKVPLEDEAAAKEAAELCPVDAIKAV